MALVYDPTQQIYADPEASALPKPPEATAYQAPEPQQTGLIGGTQKAEQYINPETATVAGQIDKNLQAGSPLIESAQADSMKTMNARGGLNSTMAASAGTKAAIDSVLPIAQQDAQTYSDFGKNEQAADLTKESASHNAELTGALNEQTFANNSNMKMFEGAIAKDLQAFNNEFDQKLVEIGIDAAERQSAQDAINNQTVTLMNNIGSWVNNTDLNLTENTPEWLTAYMYEGWQTTASLYGLDIEVV